MLYNIILFFVLLSSVILSQVCRLQLLLTEKESAINVPMNLEARRRMMFFTNSLFMNMPKAPKVRDMLSFRSVFLKAKLLNSRFLHCQIFKSTFRFFFLFFLIFFKLFFFFICMLKLLFMTIKYYALIKVLKRIFG